MNEEQDRTMNEEEGNHLGTSIMKDMKRGKYRGYGKQEAER